MNAGTGSITVNGGTITIASGGDWWSTSDTSRAIVSKNSFNFNYIAEAFVINHGQDSYNRFFGLRSSSATNAKIFVLLPDSDRSHITNVYRDTTGASAAWYGENSGIANPGNNKIGKLERIGDTVNSYYDGSLTNSRNVANWDLIYVALTDTNAIGNPTEFDWIRVRKYASTEPSWGSFSDENNKTITDWINHTIDLDAPWQWNFAFPNDTGYYRFYSIGQKTGSADELPPSSPDAICHYSISLPIINSYNLTNSTGSKLNNLTGHLTPNTEYTFTINITDETGWQDIQYINITAWYDNGSELSFYNQTNGGNLNMFLQYENTTGTANWSMLWPDDEATLILTNCTETTIDSNTKIINFSFKPLSQVRWANSNESWNKTQNATNDPWSWNFNITVTDTANQTDWKTDEYGIYRYTSVLPSGDWVDVIALPGSTDESSTVTITYSSNYDYNMSLYFEENLTHTTYGVEIPIMNNVWILANTDTDDDITTDKQFKGIGEENSIDIFNTSGTFSVDNVSQTVDVQFRVYIPFGTLWGEYTARVATTINQDIE
jgi:hypothetical protein